MVLFHITENEPSKMHNVRPYVYSSPCRGVSRKLAIIKSILLIVIYTATNNKLGEENRINKREAIPWLLT